MQFGILGPFEVRHSGELLPLGGLRQRAVLARLLLDAPRAVAVDRLVEDVWDGQPPATAHKTLQKYVSELRKALPEPVLVTAGSGYRVEVDDDAVDARRFERLVTDGDPGGALALWRGDVLADLGDLRFVTAERTRLGEARLAAEAARLDGELGDGRYAECVGAAAELAAAHPLDERFTALHMRALYGAGRHVEALRAFEQHRRRLAEEVGVEPGPALRRLEAAVLRHDPDLGTPPTAAPTAPPPGGNLPLALTSFVGRRSDLAATAAALAEHRLVTLTGPGGVGKTRLALEVGRAAIGDRPGGTWLVDLSGVGSPELVVDAVASVVSVEPADGGDELPVLVDALANRPPCLLVLDNCEHVVEACAALLDAVLRAGPGVTVLATSRRPIGVDGEFVRPVAPLPVDEAVALFAERARLAGTELGAGDAGLATAADICRRIDGLPLAIELIASQLRVLDAEEISARLEDRLQVPGTSTSAPPRQRTLLDTMRWSYELVPPETQRVFATLGVFSSSLTLEAAEAVCEVPGVLDHVTTLVDHSLLTREAGGTPARFRLLETLRLFALERLGDSCGDDGARRAHARYYLDLAREGGASLHGPEEQRWRTRMEDEEPNLLAALQWTAEHDPEASLRLAVAMWPYWDVRWSERYGVAFFASLLDRTDVTYDDHLRAWALTAVAELAANPGEARRSVTWADAAVAAFRRLDDDAGLAHALFALGLALGNGGRLLDAERALDEGMAIARRLGVDIVLARALNAVSYVAIRLGQVDRAVELNREEVAVWRRLGSRRGEATALRHLAVAQQYLGDLDEADALCRAALDLWEQIGDPASIAHVRLTLADVARLRGDHAGAAEQYGDALAVFRSIGDRRCTASTFKNQALLAAAAGDPVRSVELFRRGIALRHELGDEAGLAEGFEGLAAALWAVGERERAVVLVAAAGGIRDATGAQAFGQAAELPAEVLRRAVDELGDDAVASATVRGRRLTVPEVVELALEPG